LLGPDYTGALFVLNQRNDYEYDAYMLNSEDEIQSYLDAFGLTPAETNRLIDVKQTKPEDAETAAIKQFITSLLEEFPSSYEMSLAARMIQQKAFDNDDLIKTNPDKILLSWIEEESRLFFAIENDRYSSLISKGFSSVDEFTTLANTILNRRKSRAGKSLENHLSAIFDGNDIKYTAQGITEGNKKPDFIFPSIEDYHDKLFSIDRLCTLAAKTTCKDRWRQVLNEANRLRDKHKYLCTMQQGISSRQMDEMESEGVILVVPKPYISTYPKEKQNLIWTLNKFVGYVKEILNFTILLGSSVPKIFMSLPTHARVMLHPCFMRERVAAEISYWVFS